MIKSRTLFILIGDDKTGKTTLQKLLIEKLCNHVYTSLPTNLRFPITHPEIKRKYQDISFANRSYQEKIKDYGNVEEYFEKHFNPADISIISSHLNETDIIEMIRNGHQRFYNVIGIFFSNSIQSNPIINSRLSILNWDERLFVENPITRDENIIVSQLNLIAENFVVFISNRTSVS